jgi:hypothetical protein
MTDIQGKMMFGNASSMVDMAKRSTSVVDRAIQRCAKNSRCIRRSLSMEVFIKNGFSSVGNDAIIKFVDKFSDSLFATDSFK